MNEGIGISISDIDIESFHIVTKDFLRMQKINGFDFLSDIDIPYSGKWDWAVPKGLLRKSYCSNALNFEEAISWLNQVKDGVVRL
ncbi:MAG: hypothetical protein EOP48_29270 [Sphingobacteriales bacterium]|nr:MAG: hypothetical protein EOP48_29270 [Sphingobacteriales bacterium]